MIWGDNKPFYLHANIILKTIDVGNDYIRLIGDSPGTKMIKRSSALATGTFIEH